MLLITYSFKKNQNFELLQDFLHNEFSSDYIQHCRNFFECGRKTTEISFLFLEKEIHIFYSIPKCDEYDIVLINKPCNIKEFMIKLHNIFDGDIDLSAHLSYNNTKCPKKYLFFSFSRSKSLLRAVSNSLIIGYIASLKVCSKLFGYIWKRALISSCKVFLDSFICVSTAEFDAS